MRVVIGGWWGVGPSFWGWRAACFGGVSWVAVMCFESVCCTTQSDRSLVSCGRTVLVSKGS